MERYRAWLVSQRLLATDGTQLAKAIDYSLKHWPALVRYLEDGQLPIDNNQLSPKFVQLPWAAPIGNSPDPCAQESVPQR